MGREPADLYHRWIMAWNGCDVDLGEIFHADVLVRQMPHERHGINAVREMIAQGRAPFDPIHFRIEVDPVVGNDMLAARWLCEGTYRGGMPGVSAEPGTRIVFGGIDLWRFTDGKVSDYWVSSDGLWLMEQLNP